MVLTNFKRHLQSGTAGLLCGFTLAFAALAALPFVGCGLMDDWSYFRTAEILARTGHLVYNGWATATLGWQVYWGAAFIRCFGDSFTSARMSTLCLSVVSVWLFEAILERSGLTRRNAVFGALMLGLSPAFLPLTDMFMTDADALFVMIACWYLCLRAMQSPDDRRAIGWLCLAGIAAGIGGTVRQTAWLPGLCLLPPAVWSMRKRHRALLTGVTVWILVLVAMLWWMHWWHQEPFAVDDPPIEIGVWYWLGKREATRRLVALLLRTFPCCAYMLFPAFAAWLTRFRELALRFQIAVGLLYAMAFAWMAHEAISGHLDMLKPWLWGMMGFLDTTARGAVEGRSDTYLTYFSAFVSATVLMAATAFLLWRKPTRTFASDDNDTVSLRRTIVFTGPYILCSAALLATRYIGVRVYDRYLLGLFPIGIFFVLMAWQRRTGRRLPMLSYLVLTAMAAFSIMGIHDSFACMRARQSTESALVRSGVPPLRISNGPEIDGMKQIDAMGYIDHELIRNPPYAYFPNSHAANTPESCKTWLYDKSPAVQPQYVIDLGVQPCIAGQPLEEHRYATWLPPFHRVISVMKLPGKASTK